MYTYETFPGQTIVRRRTDGFGARDLIDELDRNGEGSVVTDEDDSDPDDFLSALEGLVCGNMHLHHGAWEPYISQLQANER